MQTTIDLLDRACAKLGGISDYRLAQIMGVNRSVVSNWRTGARTIDNDHALKLAEILEVSPMYVIACASAERTSDKELKRLWSWLARSAAAILAAILIGWTVHFLEGTQGVTAGASILLTDSGYLMRTLVTIVLALAAAAAAVHAANKRTLHFPRV